MLHSLVEMRLNHVLSKGKAKMLRPGTGITIPGEGILRIGFTALALTLVYPVSGSVDISAQAESNSVSHDGDTGQSNSDGDRGSNSDGDGDRGSGGDGDNGGGSDGDGDSGTNTDGDRGSGVDGDGDRGSGSDSDWGDDRDSRKAVRRSNSNLTVSPSSNVRQRESCQNSEATYGNTVMLRQRCNGPSFR